MPEGSPGDRNRRARTVLIVDDDLDVLKGLALADRRSDQGEGNQMV